MTAAASNGPRAGARRAGVAILLLAWLGVVAPGAWAEDGLYLTDPATGREVRVDGGQQILHLAFFATWCPDCLDELTALADLSDRWDESGYKLVLVAVPERQTAERLQGFVDNRRPPGRVLLDAGGRLGKRFDVGRVPTHVLLDAAGREIGRFDDAAAAGQAIAARLGGERRGR